MPIGKRKYQSGNNNVMEIAGETLGMAQAGHVMIPAVF